MTAPFLDRITASRPSAPGWSTSSFGHAAATSPAELFELGAHLRACDCASGRLLALQCGGEAVHGFLASRIVTTVVVATALGALASALAAG
jgi:hypothetical protein